MTETGKFYKNKAYKFYFEYGETIAIGVSLLAMFLLIAFTGWIGLVVLPVTAAIPFVTEYLRHKNEQARVAAAVASGEIAVEVSPALQTVAQPTTPTVLVTPAPPSPRHLQVQNGPATSPISPSKISASSSGGVFHRNFRDRTPEPDPCLATSRVIEMEDFSQTPRTP